MKRTTIFADERLLAELEAASRAENRPRAEIVREALEAYLRRRRTRRKPLSFVGVGASGRRTVAERHEQLLWKKRS